MEQGQVLVSTEHLSQQLPVEFIEPPKSIKEFADVVETFRELRWEYGLGKPATSAEQAIKLEAKRKQHADEYIDKKREQEALKKPPLPTYEALQSKAESEIGQLKDVLSPVDRVKLEFQRLKLLTTLRLKGVRNPENVVKTLELIYWHHDYKLNQAKHDQRKYAASQKNGYLTSTFTALKSIYTFGESDIFLNLTKNMGNVEMANRRYYDLTHSLLPLTKAEVNLKNEVGQNIHSLSTLADIPEPQYQQQRNVLQRYPYLIPSHNEILNDGLRILHPLIQFILQHKEITQTETTTLDQAKRLWNIGRYAHDHWLLKQYNPEWLLQHSELISDELVVLEQYLLEQGSSVSERDLNSNAFQDHINLLCTRDRISKLAKLIKAGCSLSGTGLMAMAVNALPGKLDTLIEKANALFLTESHQTPPSLEPILFFGDLFTAQNGTEVNWLTMSNLDHIQGYEVHWQELAQALRIICDLTGDVEMRQKLASKFVYHSSESGYGLNYYALLGSNELESLMESMPEEQKNAWKTARALKENYYVSRFIADHLKDFDRFYQNEMFTQAFFDEFTSDFTQQLQSLKPNEQKVHIQSVNRFLMERVDTPAAKALKKYFYTHSLDHEYLSVLGSDYSHWNTYTDQQAYLTINLVISILKQSHGDQKSAYLAALVLNDHVISSLPEVEHKYWEYWKQSQSNCGNEWVLYLFDERDKTNEYLQGKITLTALMMGYYQDEIDLTDKTMHEVIKGYHRNGDLYRLPLPEQFILNLAERATFDDHRYLLKHFSQLSKFIDHTGVVDIAGFDQYVHDNQERDIQVTYLLNEAVMYVDKHNPNKGYMWYSIDPEVKPIINDIIDKAGGMTPLNVSRLNRLTPFLRQEMVGHTVVAENLEEFELLIQANGNVSPYDHIRFLIKHNSLHADLFKDAFIENMQGLDREFWNMWRTINPAGQEVFTKKFQENQLLVNDAMTQRLKKLAPYLSPSFPGSGLIAHDIENFETMLDSITQHKKIGVIAYFQSRNLNDIAAAVVPMITKEEWKLFLGEDVFKQFLQSLPTLTDEARNAFTHNQYDRVTPFTQFVVKECGADFSLTPQHLQMLGEYIQIFKLARSADLLHYFLSIRSVELGLKTELPPGIRESGIRSIPELLARYQELEQSAYSNKPILPEQIKKLTSFEKNLLRTITGKDRHRFDSGRPSFEMILSAFLSDYEASKIPSLPEAYTSEVVVLSEKQIIFDKEAAKAEYTELSEEILAGINHTNSLEDILPKYLAYLEEKIEATTLALSRVESGKRVFLEKELYKQQQILAECQNLDTVEGLLTTLIKHPFSKGDRSLYHSFIRTLLFKQLFQKHNSPHFIQNLAITLEQHEVTPASLLATVNVVDSMVKQHLLNLKQNNQEQYWSDEMFSLLKEGKTQDTIEGLFANAKKVREVIKTFQEEVTGSRVEVEMVPDTGLIGEMSAYLADVCYSKEFPLLSRWPVVPYKFITTEDGVKKFIGSVLLFTVRDQGGDQILLIRAFDIPEEDKYPIPDLIESFISKVSKTGKQVGAKRILMAGMPGAISNYQMTTNYFFNHYLIPENVVPLAEPFAFNGYDVTNKCYLVRDLSE